MTLRVRNWEKWQTYRRDRGQPPWIKVHRQLLRDQNWVALSDTQRGQLVGMWILAADRDGELPADARLVAKLCYMDETPDLQLFISLGFLEGDVTVTSQRRHSDHPEAETEAEAETEERVINHPEPNGKVTPGARFGALARQLAPNSRSKQGRWITWAGSFGDDEQAVRIMVGLLSLIARGALSGLVEPGEDCAPGVLSAKHEGIPIEGFAEYEFQRTNRPSRRTPGIGLVSAGRIAAAGGGL